MRLAGQVWFLPANLQGAGCAKQPETYPAQPKQAMSHGDQRKQIPFRL